MSSHRHRPITKSPASDEKSRSKSAKPVTTRRDGHGYVDGTRLKKELSSATHPAISPSLRPWRQSVSSLAARSPLFQVTQTRLSNSSGPNGEIPTRATLATGPAILATVTPVETATPAQTARKLNAATTEIRLVDETTHIRQHRGRSFGAASTAPADVEPAGMGCLQLDDIQRS
ncbi:MAG: hypothetical protein J07HN4v3_02583 [Halonotius sp. J07HN4]|nr:MAG: hypothetical protein J07HN4v3_02583 [Halonotius sp. J07HN4]